VINDRDLMRLHVEALFTRDGAGHLVAVNEPNGVAAPRFFLGRTAGGNAWWLRHDVDPAVGTELVALCESQPTVVDLAAEPGDAAPFIALLARQAPVNRTWAGPAFRVPLNLTASENAVRVTAENAMLLDPYLADWAADVAPGVPMAVALESGKAVSVCCSVRMSPQVHEAGVETHPDFRGRGHAARAVAEWARVAGAMDCIPLYSTSWQNQASLALARKLGLIQYGADLHIT
jgi:RimJ/RimL family protein N-acetyltransferase